MTLTFSFNEKRQILLDYGFTLADLKQFVEEMEEEAAESQADNMTIMDFLIPQLKLSTFVAGVV